jgi:O-acetyl-ADP-ribose deacetylase (regulator of RNase III)
MKVTEIKGNLITLTQQEKFDVIVQGNNCFCVQGAGLAGGDWNKIKGIILRELVDCDVTLVEYKK